MDYLHHHISISLHNTSHICYIYYNRHIYYITYFSHIISDAYTITKIHITHSYILFHKYSSIVTLWQFTIYVILHNIYHLFIFCVTTTLLNIFHYSLFPVSLILLHHIIQGYMPCIGNVEPLILVQNSLSYLSLFTSSYIAVGFNLYNTSLCVSPFISPLSNLRDTISCISSLLNSIWSLTSSYSITGVRFCVLLLQFLIH